MCPMQRESPNPRRAMIIRLGVAVALTHTASALRLSDSHVASLASVSVQAVSKVDDLKSEFDAAMGLPEDGDAREEALSQLTAQWSIHVEPLIKSSLASQDADVTNLIKLYQSAVETISESKVALSSHHRNRGETNVALAEYENACALLWNFHTNFSPRQTWEAVPRCFNDLATEYESLGRADELAVVQAQLSHAQSPALEPSTRWVSAAAMARWRETVLSKGVDDTEEQTAWSDDHDNGHDEEDGEEEEDRPASVTTSVSVRSGAGKHSTAAASSQGQAGNGVLGKLLLTSSQTNGFSRHAKAHSLSKAEKEFAEVEGVRRSLNELALRFAHEMIPTSAAEKEEGEFDLTAAGLSESVKSVQDMEVVVQHLIDKYEVAPPSPSHRSSNDGAAGEFKQDQELVNACLDEGGIYTSAVTSQVLDEARRYLEIARVIQDTNDWAAFSSDLSTATTTQGAIAAAAEQEAPEHEGVLTMAGFQSHMDVAQVFRYCRLHARTRQGLKQREQLGDAAVSRSSKRAKQTASKTSWAEGHEDEKVKGSGAKKSQKDAKKKKRKSSDEESRSASASPLLLLVLACAGVFAATTNKRDRSGRQHKASVLATLTAYSVLAASSVWGGVVCAWCALKVDASELASDPLSGPNLKRVLLRNGTRVVTAFANAKQGGSKVSREVAARVSSVVAMRLHRLSRGRFGCLPVDALLAAEEKSSGTKKSAASRKEHSNGGGGGRKSSRAAPVPPAVSVPLNGVSSPQPKKKQQAPAAAAALRCPPTDARSTEASAVDTGAAATAVSTAVRMGFGDDAGDWVTEGTEMPTPDDADEWTSAPTPRQRRLATAAAAAINTQLPLPRRTPSTRRAAVDGAALATSAQLQPAKKVVTRTVPPSVVVEGTEKGKEEPALCVAGADSSDERAPSPDSIAYVFSPSNTQHKHDSKAQREARKEMLLHGVVTCSELEETKQPREELVAVKAEEAQEEEDAIMWDKQRGSRSSSRSDNTSSSASTEHSEDETSDTSADQQAPSSCEAGEDVANQAFESKDGAGNGAMAAHQAWEQEQMAAMMNMMQAASPFPPEMIDAARWQMEYYFSAQNLCRDVYLRKHMDHLGFVSLATIAEFNKIKSFLLHTGAGPLLLLVAIGSSPVLQVAFPWALRTSLPPNGNKLSDSAVLSCRVRTTMEPERWVLPEAFNVVN
eukprot:CAMPEP_0171930000 /NCGR_PEP_ID=MMETSP0993-20121228/28142_1 /TAXON_ID=483369 /ORGANISM="non described non described, Strain CCMP2098" /LENGTH=1182 /DNA_ID=CAMNT_0012569677 /DNA_START=26 /DNA_END=3574 /DNA_ORIENTATION=-